MHNKKEKVNFNTFPILLKLQLHYLLYLYIPNLSSLIQGFLNTNQYINKVINSNIQ